MDIHIISQEPGIRKNINLNTLQKELRKSDITFGDLLDYLKEKVPVLQEISRREELTFHYINEDGRFASLMRNESVSAYRAYSEYGSFYLKKKFDGIGEIESRYERVPDTPLIEAREAASFRGGLTVGGLILGGFFGFLIYNLNFIQGMNANVAGIAGVAALIGVVAAASKLAHRAGENPVGWGCGTLVAGVIGIAILEHFPHALSTVAWSLVYGSLANLLSISIQRALERRDKAIPIVAGIGAVMLAVIIVIIGFTVTKKEIETRLVREKAAQEVKLAKKKAEEAIIKVIMSKLHGQWEGEWEKSGLNNPLAINSAEFKLSLNLHGSNLTGTYYERGGSTNINGAIEGNKISFEYKYSDGGGRKYVGTINNTGTEAQGKWEQENGSGTWKMVKKIKLSYSQIKGIATQLHGEWRGEVGNKGAELSIAQDGAQLYGRILYEGVEEKLAVEIQDNGQIVLKGVSYRRLSGRGDFALDTFYGRLSDDNRSIKGQYKDEAGNKGKWSVSKVSENISAQPETPQQKSPSTPYGYDMKDGQLAPAPITPAEPSQKAPPPQKPEPTNFEVTIQSLPSGASVKIDKELRGITPLSIVLEKGSYGMAIEKEGYNTKWDMIIIGKDSKKEFYFTLEKE